MFQAVASAFALALTAAELVGAIVITAVIVVRHVPVILGIVRKLGGK